ncbi:MAG TPA: PAAR-like domain-containing protein [Steroidobacteraceae bacterium]|nr:PAAR-like domain-containing protein [Steroidobacteraceae bacterium]
MLVSTSSPAGISLSPAQTYKVPFPPAVVPGVNTALSSMAIPAQTKVMIGTGLALTQSCQIPASVCAPPLLGVISGGAMGMCKTTSASTALMLGGKPALRATDPTLNNSANGPGMRMPDSNTKMMAMK